MAEEFTNVNTDSGRSDGLNKCPRCGSAEISLKPGTGRLQCHYCRHVFDAPAPVSAPSMAPPPAGAPIPFGAEGRPETRSSGVADIAAGASSQVTIKCQGCGAEIVIDTNESMTARCHWCRQMLSVEHQIPNGAVPDMVLPFMLSKEQARAKIEQFVQKRSFFANTRFKQEFTTENITGAYLPYIIVDATTHNTLNGAAGHVTRTYTRCTGNDKETFYDIDHYNIGRDFDLSVSGLTLEASSDKRAVSAHNTNNVINTIMPFDIENAVAYNGNYLKGFTSERRDTNIDQVKELAGLQLRDIGRYQANKTATAYDAGIRWEKENLDITGTSWRSAYLPVWLYSYLEVKTNGSQLLHYVAVNARTGETMGSVPISKQRLFLVSLIIELVAIPLGILISALS